MISQNKSTNNTKLHTSVMLQESLQHLNIQPDGTYIDCTLGEGGHSYEIFKKLSSNGTILSIDQDKTAIEFTKDFFKDVFNSIEVTKDNSNQKGPQWILRHANFSNLSRFTKELSLKPNGILMDLGLSSRQLEPIGNKRGFSYQNEDASLDMRMDQNLAVSAKDILKVLNEHELVKLLRLYGEERHARQIAKSIKNAEALETVGDLNKAIRRAVPAAFRQKGKHPSRRVFQALRIAVNDELNSLKDTLKQAIDVLESKGRLVIISFHSLEDRIVKRFMIDAVKENKGILIETKSLTATQKELDVNPRARSAKFRVFEKA